MSEIRDGRRHPSFHPSVDSSRTGSQESTPPPSRLSSEATPPWTYTSQPNPHKARLLEPVLTTASASFGAATYSEAHNPSEEEERMTINVNSLYLDSVVDHSQVDLDKRKGGQRGFVGGFLNSLKKLPKVVRKGSGPPRYNTVEYDQISRSGAANNVGLMPFRTSQVEVPTVRSQVAFVEPVATYSQEPPQVSMEVPPTAIPSNFYNPYDMAARDSCECDSPNYGFQYYYDTNPEQPVIHPALQMMMAHSDTNATYQSDSEAPAVHYNTPASGPGFAADLLNPTPPPSGLFSDTTQTESSLKTPSEPSSPPRLGITRVFKSLHRLPWVSSRITSVYVARKRSDGRPPTEKIPASSWYFHPRHSLDLFSSGESSSASPVSPIDHHNPNEFARATSADPSNPHLTPKSSRKRGKPRTMSDAGPLTSSNGGRNPTRIPNPDTSNLTAANANTHDRRRVRHTSASSSVPTSPNNSRDKGHRVRASGHSSQRSDSPRFLGYPHNYSPFPYNPLPQPLYILTPPSQPSSVGGHAEMHQAIPLYMISPTVPPAVASSPRRPAVPDPTQMPGLMKSKKAKNMSAPPFRTRVGQTP